ncbi:jg14977 [Pararge aegeria aegeria]|uniref:Jg14977 protein n=1 Tax=Pararge aegeria aegeria TaxID=348720 RepID=A0A8S4SKE0_9NEOP|nr:jg14977 [Pararge aegeria aegeria]
MRPAYPGLHYGDLHWVSSILPSGTPMGFQNKAHLLKDLLSQRRVDIGLINETHLRPVDKLKVPGCFVYRKDHA